MKNLLKVYKGIGGDPLVLSNPKIASLVVRENKILSVNQIKGIVMKAREIPTGIKGIITVKKGYKLKNPVHLCFGVMPKTGIQEILITLNIEEKASAEFIAHCMFPNAVKVQHIMNAKFNIGKEAFLQYNETHYHGMNGGIEVVPKIKVNIKEKGIFQTTFSLVKGRVGKLNFNYDVEAGEKAIAELITKAYGYGDDEIYINEKISLNGKGSRGLIKARIAIKDNAKSEIIGITEGNAPFSRGHVDCVEIVQDNAIAKANPIVKVSNDKAKVTHEAAIGSVDKKELETLMARGLTKEEATDMIIRGLLN